MVWLPLFVYGTLRDSDILAAVLGHAPAKTQMTPASAAGYRVVPYPDRSYPALVPVATDTATGLLLSDLSPTDLARLDAFEGNEYLRATLTVQSGGMTRLALAYLPTIEIAHHGKWSLEHWTRHHKTKMLLDLIAMAGQDGPHQAQQ